jgi:hypothetical protein
MKRIFISYSHKDEQRKNKVTIHLNVLPMQGELEIGEDWRIKPGEKFNQMITQ